MTTHFRTLLLLGFTGFVALSGCIIETTGNKNPGPNAPACTENQYFQVYWSIAANANTTPWTCNQAPAATVELVTNNGTYRVGRECRLQQYMGLVFDFAGSTLAVPVGTYVVTSNLVSDADGTVLSVAPGAGPQYAVQSCRYVEIAHAFELQ